MYIHELDSASEFVSPALSGKCWDFNICACLRERLKALLGHAYR